MASPLISYTSHRLAKSEIPKISCMIIPHVYQSESRDTRKQRVITPPPPLQTDVDRVFKILTGIIYVDIPTTNLVLKTNKER